MVVEAAEAVPWTRPDELPVTGSALEAVSGKKPEFTVPTLGGVFADGFHAGLADGSVAFVKADTPPAEVFKVLTPAGGEALRLRTARKTGVYLIPALLKGEG